VLARQCYLVGGRLVVNVGQPIHRCCSGSGTVSVSILTGSKSEARRRLRRAAKDSAPRFCARACAKSTVRSTRGLRRTDYTAGCRLYCRQPRKARCATAKWRTVRAMLAAPRCRPPARLEPVRHCRRNPRALRDARRQDRLSKTERCRSAASDQSCVAQSYQKARVLPARAFAFSAYAGRRTPSLRAPAQERRRKLNGT
jgi:hypothetical protein